MRDEREDELDSVLDAALRGYSNREPRVGLEQRVLRRIELAVPTPRSWWRIGWLLAPIPVVAIALGVILLLHDRPAPQPLREIAVVAQLPAPPPPVPTIATVASKPVKLPKPERVAEPERLTAGEEALLLFARRDPEQARELFADSGQMKDLKIDPLQIEALP